VNVYTTVMFSISFEEMNYLEVCDKICAAFEEPVPGRAELEEKFAAAMRQAAEDLPKTGAIDVADLKARVEAYRERVVVDLELKYLPEVLKRIALNDFRQYPRVLQRDLLLYLGKKDQKALKRLTGRGLRWRNYVKTKPQTLFRKPIRLTSLAVVPFTTGKSASVEAAPRSSSTTHPSEAST
jgi:hypothetical protein